MPETIFQKTKDHLYRETLLKERFELRTSENVILQRLLTLMRSVGEAIAEAIPPAVQPLTIRFIMRTAEAHCGPATAALAASSSPASTAAASSGTSRDTRSTGLIRSRWRRAAAAVGDPENRYHSDAQCRRTRRAESFGLPWILSHSDTRERGHAFTRVHAPPPTSTDTGTLCF